jgi:phosphate-selective porin OprO and OprP
MVGRPLWIRTFAAFFAVTSQLASVLQGQDYSYSPIPAGQVSSPSITDPAYIRGSYGVSAPSLAQPSVSNLAASHGADATASAPTESDRIAAIEKRLNEIEAAKKKLPSVTVSGVFQADAVWFNQTDESRDQYGSIESGADFRRARLAAKGSVTEEMNYFMQMDFAFFGRPTFTDVWVEQTKVPYLGNVRVGQWKQPFSLEVVSSFRYTTFMERSSLFQPFTPFRHLGVGFYDHSDDLNSTWAASYFRTGQDQFGGSLSTDGGNGLSARGTHLLWYCGDRGQEHLHVGAGYFMNSPPRGVARFRSIPELFVSEFAPAIGSAGTSGQALPGVFNGTPFFVDTGAISDVDGIHTFGLESLWVQGPISFQSEAMAAVVDQAAPGGTLTGAYGQVGYFLTGEHRPYDRKSGAIDRVVPFSTVGKNGIGAWEVAGRLSHINLNDGGIQGGAMTDMTAGLNWYLNPYCKWVFNYIHSWVEDRPVVGTDTRNSQTDIFGTRVQVDF